MKLASVVAALMVPALLAAAPAQAQDLPQNTPIAVPAPPEGMGQIVFFRPGSMMGLAMGCQVNEGEGEPDTAKVSSLGNDRYFILQALPGTHAFWVRNERTDALTVQVEPGETRFVRCHIRMGLMSGRPDLVLSDGASFATASDGLEPVDDDDMRAPGVVRAAALGMMPAQ